MKIFSFLIFLIFSACAISEYNIGTHRQDFIFYSTEKEVNLGQNICKEVFKNYKVSQNPLDIERINRIGKKITEVCERKEITYYFYVLEESTKGERDKNAFSLPGGFVFIFKDLMDLLNDDELAYVLGHEVGHIVSRHVVKKLQAAMGYNLLMIASIGVTKDPEFVEGLSFALAQVFVAYSREDEFNADELGIKYCKLAGFNYKQAGISTLEKLYQEDKKSIRTLSYFRTHPYTQERIRHIKEFLHLPLDVNDYIN